MRRFQRDGSYKRVIHFCEITGRAVYGFAGDQNPARQQFLPEYSR